MSVCVYVTLDTFPPISCGSSFATATEGAMAVIQEVVHDRGLNFVNQRKVVLLRDTRLPNGKRLAFKKIAKLVKNLKQKATTEDVVRRVYSRFDCKKGFVKYKYARCGRSAWVITNEVGSWLIRKLLAQRRKSIVTATSLQQQLAKELKVKASTRSIRRHLLSKGYKWRPRSQKRKYTAKDKRNRVKFAKPISRLGQEAVDEHVTLAMDGVVLTVPPQDETDRLNYCLHGETHMYRKEGEAAKPELSGDDPYADQIPLSRAIPMWGAISALGFAEITYHKSKKLNTDEWAKVLNSGKLKKVIKKLQPSKRRGPWRLLCDGEGFLKAKVCTAYCRKKNIMMLHLPRRSPDLNPIERYWSWVRRALRARDLKDLRNGVAALGKTAYKIRVQRLLKTKRAQTVAKATWRTLKSVSKEVVRKKGAMARS